MNRKKIQAALERIYAKHGEVRASALIEEAEPEDSPIHDQFEWDDGKAGHEYRLIQARTYIRKVHITIEEVPERLIHVPAVKKEEGKYLPKTILVKRPDEYDRALDEALRAFRSAQKALDYLRSAAEKDPTNEKAIFIAQFSRAMELMEEALQHKH